MKQIVPNFPLVDAYGDNLEIKPPNDSQVSEADLPRVVVIDGESSTGKTTLAERLAHELGYAQVTTGMLFCAGAVALEGADIDLQSDQEIAALVQATTFDFALTAGEQPLLSVDGKDVSGELFTQIHKQQASRLNTIPEVSNHFEAILRRLASSGRWVFDRGARVFPDADIKVWLRANAYNRAVRRCGQLALGGQYMSLERVRAEQLERSRLDRENHRSPRDAIPVDTDYLDAAEVYQVVRSLILRKHDQSGFRTVLHKPSGI